jgi:hypothetical protein
MALAWPTILNPTMTMFRIDPRTVHGGVTFTGAEQVIGPTPGIWRAQLSGIACNTPARVRAFRALISGLDGRLGTVLVPVHDKRRAPLSAATFAPAIGSTVTNPLIQQYAATGSSPVGSVVVNPLVEFYAPTGSSPVGNVVVNPLVETFWPEVDAAGFEYTPKTPAVTGAATIFDLFSFTWAPTGGTLAKGDYVTLSGSRRLINHVDGTRYFFFPALISTAGRSSTLTPKTPAVTGTATIFDLFSFTWAPAGGGLAKGDYVTLFSQKRLINHIDGVRYFFFPALVSTAGISSTLTTKTGTGVATIRSEQSYDWGTTGGLSPVAGNYVTLFGVPRLIKNVTGIRHTFTPFLSMTRTPGTSTVTANNTAAIGATSIQLNRTAGSAIEAGMYFSTAAGKLYMITAVTAVAGNFFTVSFRPPARAAINAPNPIEMTSPLCEMRLASDDTGELALSNIDGYGTSSIEFIEAVANA